MSSIPQAPQQGTTPTPAGQQQQGSTPAPAPIRDWAAI